MDFHSKACISCHKEKPLSHFYKHSGMADGHLNKCMFCTREYAKTRHYLKSNDPLWVKKERARSREKYKRLGYKDKQRIWDAKKPWKNSSIYKNLSRNLKIPKGHEAHHWSYKEENLLSVFIMKTDKHRKAHKELIFNEYTLCFSTSTGEILDTREKHEYFLRSLNFI